MNKFISYFSLLAVSLLSLGLHAANSNDVLIEAESGKITAPMQVLKQEEASGHQCVYTPGSIVHAMSRKNSEGKVVFEVNIPKTGEYRLWGKVFTPGKPRTREDSFYLEFEGKKYTWIIHDWSDNWVWRRFLTEDRLEDIRFHLKEGKHRLVLKHRSSETLLDQLKFVPVEARVGEISDPSSYKASKVDKYTNLSPYFDMPDLEVPVFPDRVLDIREYGAVGDGKTMNTEAISKAIADCNEAGGGRVLIPEGKWLTGPIHLRSNIDLHISKGATVLFSQNFDDYLPVVFTRWEGMECYNYSSPIYGNGLTNIAITGEGVFDGQGEPWWAWKRNKQGKTAARLYQMIVDGVPPSGRVLGKPEDGMRPNFLTLMTCRKVLIENVTFKNGPMWTVHPVYCNEMIIRGIKVITSGPNNDGIDPDSTQNLLIEDCYFSTGDDCVVLKAGLNEDGWRVGRPTQNVVIRNIYAHEGHGGVVVGSEMSGSVRNVYAHDNYFDGTDRGLRIKSMRGRGGIVENIWFEKTKMRNIGGQVIRLNMFYSSSTVKPATEVPAAFRNIFVRDIECDGAARAVEITGLEELPIHDIYMENLRITANDGLKVTDGEKIGLKNISIKAERGVPYELINCRDVDFSSIENTVQKGALFKLSGETTGNIVIPEESVKGSLTEFIEYTNGCDEKSVTIQ